MTPPKVIKTFQRGLLATALLGLFTGHAVAENLVALNSNNQIGVFNTSTATINTSLFTTITGINAGEVFVGIDLRPSDNLIYGITTFNNIYTVDAYTGISSYVATLSQPIIDGVNKSYGFDFNPIADRTPNASLRLVSSTGDNYAINAVTGGVTVATPITSGFTGVAYQNSDASTPDTPPASTALYYVNAETDTLASAQTGFNNPTLAIEGPLGVDIFSASGFEITNQNNAYGAFNLNTSPTASGLFSVNLDTGAAFQIASFTGGVTALTSASVSPVPEPETYGMLMAGLGLVGFVSRRRKNR